MSPRWRPGWRRSSWSRTGSGRCWCCRCPSCRCPCCRSRCRCRSPSRPGRAGGALLAPAVGHGGRRVAGAGRIAVACAWLSFASAEVRFASAWSSASRGRLDLTAPAPDPPPRGRPGFTLTSMSWPLSVKFTSVCCTCEGAAAGHRGCTTPFSAVTVRVRVVCDDFVGPTTITAAGDRAGAERAPARAMTSAAWRSPRGASTTVLPRQRNFALEQLKSF